MQTFHFDSVAQLVALENKPLKRKENGRLMKKLKTHQGVAWLGVSTRKEYFDNLRTGNASVLSSMTAMLQTLDSSIPMAQGIKRTLVRSDAGDEYDIHAANAGRFDQAWESRKRRIRTAPSTVRIVADIGGNRHTAPEQLQWRGFAAALLAHKLTDAGYNVEIVGAFCVSNSWADSDALLFQTVVKPSSSSLDLDLLSSTIMSPAFFRASGLCAIVHAADDAKKNVRTALGYALAVDEFMPPDESVSQLIIPATVDSESKCIKWVTDSITMLEAMK
jgi:hypothetical protein